MKKKKTLLAFENPTPLKSIVEDSGESYNTTNTSDKTITKIHSSQTTKTGASEPPKNQINSEQRQFVPKPGRISISGKEAIVVEAHIEDQQKKQIIENNSFTAKELEMVWNKFADTIPELGRIASFIRSTTPELINNLEFAITVNNTLLEREFKRLQSDIQEFIQINLQNSQVKMNINLEVETEKSRGTSPEERFQMMAKQNPAIAKLRHSLNLEID